MKNRNPAFIQCPDVEIVDVTQITAQYTSPLLPREEAVQNLRMFFIFALSAV
jgi:hypothetical protein